MNPNILVTGGAGYIGSHTCKALSGAGYTPIAYDNLSRGHREAVRWGELVVGDIEDGARLRDTIARHRPAAVIHFAAFAYVGESVSAPSMYYRNNVLGTLSLLEACREAGLDKLVFSSSCAIYGAPEVDTIAEDTPKHPINPYGRTKLIGEQMLEDFAAAYGSRFVALRYFNAAGIDPEGELGEWHDPEPHLVPRVLMAAHGLAPSFSIFGDDYATPDGTCIRDLIHVADLARAHVKAMQHLLSGGDSLRVNLGAGQGTSVRDVVAAVEAATGRSVPVVVEPRRPGDPPRLVADNRLAARVLGFTPQLSDLRSIVATANRQFEAIASHAA